MCHVCHVCHVCVYRSMATLPTAGITLANTCVARTYTRWHTCNRHIHSPTHVQQTHTLANTCARDTYTREYLCNRHIHSFKHVQHTRTLAQTCATDTYTRQYMCNRHLYLPKTCNRNIHLPTHVQQTHVQQTRTHADIYVSFHVNTSLKISFHVHTSLFMYIRLFSCLFSCAFHACVLCVCVLQHGNDEDSQQTLAKCVALCCTVLHCVTVRCSLLQSVAVCCITLATCTYLSCHISFMYIHLFSCSYVSFHVYTSLFRSLFMYILIFSCVYDSSHVSFHVHTFLAMFLLMYICLCPSLFSCAFHVCGSVFMYVGLSSFMCMRVSWLPQHGNDDDSHYCTHQDVYMSVAISVSTYVGLFSCLFQRAEAFNVLSLSTCWGLVERESLSTCWGLLSLSTCCLFVSFNVLRSFFYIHVYLCVCIAARQRWRRPASHLPTSLASAPLPTPLPKVFF